MQSTREPSGENCDCADGRGSGHDPERFVESAAGAWRRDGKELFYRSQDKVMAVETRNTNNLEIGSSRQPLKAESLRRYCWAVVTRAVAPISPLQCLADLG